VGLFVTSAQSIEPAPALFSAVCSDFCHQPSAAPAATSPPLPEDDAYASLSAREREILGLIARGDSNKLIARELDIAETTVKVHVQHIFRKLNLSSRVQVAVYAAARGLG
jgi:two-component system nitrate/nitrite response regulator NarL